MSAWVVRVSGFDKESNLKHPRPRKSLIHFTAAALLGLGLAACSQATEPGEEVEQTESELSADPAEAPAPEAKDARKRFQRGPHGDPAKMIERMDANKNGTLELSEVPEKMRGFLEKADSDKDGALSADELKAHGRQMADQHFAKKDENKDGFWSKDEVGERRWAKLSEADTDKDGKLSKLELETAHKEGKLMGMRGHGMRGKGFKKDPAHFIERFDADKNGTLELSELPEHKREKLSAADTDKDQKLSSAEIEAHFKAKFGDRKRRFEKKRSAGDLAL